MLKRIFYFLVIGFFLTGLYGCTLLNTALSAGVAYGLYKLTSD